MIRKVFETLKEDSKNGDFICLTNSDRRRLAIDLSDEEVQTVSKVGWKKYLDKKTKDAAFIYLSDENLKKENTRNIVFQSLDMSTYLKTNKRKSLTQIIFSIRSKTLNIKEFQPWNYEDNLCVQCEIFAETMDHFCTCKAYNTETEAQWTDIFIDNTERQFEIAQIVEKRLKIRQSILEKEEDGLASTDPGSTCSSL